MVTCITINNLTVLIADIFKTRNTIKALNTSTLEYEYQ